MSKAMYLKVADPTSDGLFFHYDIHKIQGLLLSKFSIACYANELVLEAKSQFYKKTLVFRHALRPSHSSIFQTISTIGNISSISITSLSLFSGIYNFTEKPFFPRGFTLPPLKTESLNLRHPYSGTTLPLHQLTHMSILFISNDHLLIFSLSPPSLSHVAASPSHPSSEHLRCLTLI